MNTNQLYALLEERGIDPSAQPVILMRHKDKRYRLYKYLGTKALTLYQAMQKHRHKQKSLVVGFYGHKPGHGILLGIWRVIEVMSPEEAHRKGLLDGSFEPFEAEWDGFYHELEETDLLSDLRLKLEIQWGGRDNSWRRVLRPTNDYPTRIQSDPMVPFDGVKNASLVIAELRVALQDVLWQQGLGEIAGVYLITDEYSGKHYVGSASGAEGILQRWAEYAHSGHGGNSELIGLLRDFPGRESHFRFTVIEAMQRYTSRAEVVARESFWKTALGSRTFGLNSN